LKNYSPKTACSPENETDPVIPRTILSLGAALDHRVVDASHGGLLFRYLKKIVKNPHLLDEKI
jgi:hypothetical protein